MARQAYRRYLREFLPAMAVYMAVMLLLWPQVPHLQNPWWKGALALTPVLPMVFVVRAMVRLVLGSDELEQRIHLIGLAAATACVGVVSMAGGFLAAAHVIALDGTVLIWVFPVLVLSYGFARGWASRRYGGNGMCGDEEEGALGRRWLWLVVVVLAVVAAFSHGRLGDREFGLLIGTTAALAAYGLISGIRRWFARRSANHAG